MLSTAALSFVNIAHIGQVLREVGRATCPGACSQCAVPQPEFAEAAEFAFLNENPLSTEAVPDASNLNERGRDARAQQVWPYGPVTPYPGALRLSLPYGAGPYQATSVRHNPLGYLEAFGFTAEAPAGEWALLRAGQPGCGGLCQPSSRSERAAGLAAAACRQLGYSRGWAFAPLDAPSELPKDVGRRVWSRSATCAGDEPGVTSLLADAGFSPLPYGSGGCYLADDGASPAPSGAAPAEPPSAPLLLQSTNSSNGTHPIGGLEVSMLLSPFGIGSNYSAEEGEPPLLVGCSSDTCADVTWALDMALVPGLPELVSASLGHTDVSDISDLPVAVNSSGRLRRGLAALEAETFGGLRSFDAAAWAPQRPSVATAQAVDAAISFRHTRCATPPNCAILSSLRVLCEQPLNAWYHPAYWLMLGAVWMPTVLYRSLDVENTPHLHAFLFILTLVYLSEVLTFEMECSMVRPWRSGGLSPELQQVADIIHVVGWALLLVLLGLVLIVQSEFGWRRWEVCQSLKISSTAYFLLQYQQAAIEWSLFVWTGLGEWWRTLRTRMAATLSTASCRAAGLTLTLCARARAPQ